MCFPLFLYEITYDFLHLCGCTREIVIDHAHVELRSERHFILSLSETTRYGLLAVGLASTQAR